MSSAAGRQRYFYSRRLHKSEIPGPRQEEKDPREKWLTIIPLLSIFIGCGLAGFLVWNGVQSVPRQKYCLVLNETFQTGLNSDVWTKEIEVGGFGRGEFQQTTGDEENIFLENNHLVIQATLQDPDKMEKSCTVDLIHEGICTSPHYVDCVAETNTTAGNRSVIPPTKSARINTKVGASLKYGRVEVTAKLPEGDWLRPSIVLLPVREVYGPWPASGEIDIMESRGNNWTYPMGGNNIAMSTLQWGPDKLFNGCWKMSKNIKAHKTTWSAGFNTFGLEWSQNYLFTYVNNRLLQVLYTKFDVPMWARGGFPAAMGNGTKIPNPWAESDRLNAPFDQAFYLVISLAVGGANGWFGDGEANKPWVDGSENAKWDFWKAREDWLSTWKRPRLEVKQVLMKQQCNGDEGV